MRLHSLHPKQYIHKLRRSAHIHPLLRVIIPFLRHSQCQLHHTSLHKVSVHPPYFLKIPCPLYIHPKPVRIYIFPIMMHIIARCHQRRRRRRMTRLIQRKRIIPVRIPVPIPVSHPVTITRKCIPRVRYPVPIIIRRVRHITTPHLVQPHISRLAYVKMYIWIGQ